MQLQPKSVDSSQNVIDLRKARNANELITVLGRINTALRLRQGQHKVDGTKVRFEPLPKLYQTLSWILQTQEELQCAVSTAQHLNDSKRDKCLVAIERLNVDVLELRRRMISRINTGSIGTVSETLHKFANVIHDTIRNSAEKIYSIAMFDENVTYLVLIARNLTGNDNFVSPEVCIKLKQDDTGIYVSLPYSPFVETSEVIVSSVKDLTYFLMASLNCDKKTPKLPAEDKLLRLDGVTRIDVTDTLNLWLDRAVLPHEINAILRRVVPLVRKSVDIDEFEILHRFQTVDDTKCLQLCLGKRKVADPRALSKLTRLLGLSKSQVSQMNTMLETP